MKTVEEQYGKSFFGRRYKLSWRAPHVIDAIEETFGIKNSGHIRYLDVGCAIGDLVVEAFKRGFNAYGIEGSTEAKPFLECSESKVLFIDLRKPVSLEFKFHIVSCFEVAEHIEEKYADIFVDNLCSLSGCLVVSAAPPGQKGHYHYNCQLPKYWDKKFAERNFVKFPILEEVFRHALFPWRKKDGIRAFYNNVLIYKNKSIL